MAIAVKLDDLLHDRRMTLTELADRVGMTLANLSILKTGKARAIRFSTLDAICQALSCQPADILRFDPEQQDRDKPPAASYQRNCRGPNKGDPPRQPPRTLNQPEGCCPAVRPPQPRPRLS